MFISRKRYERLIERIETLEMYAERDYEKLQRDYKRIGDLEKAVGPVRSRSMLSMMMERFYGVDSEPELSLWDTLQQVMAHLGLEIKSTSASTKVMKKAEPKPKKKTVTKKGKK